MWAYQWPRLPVYRAERRVDIAIVLFLGVAVLALFVYLTIAVGEAPATLTVSGALLACGLPMAITGRAPRGVAPEIRHSGSRAAIRCTGGGLLVMSAGFTAGGLQWLTSGRFSPELLSDDWMISLLAVLGIVLVPQWLSWRAVRNNPFHPAHATVKPYFWGDAPSARVAIVAAVMGVVSAGVALFTLFHFEYLPGVTLPLSAITLVLAAIALLHTFIRRAFSRVLPVIAVASGLLTLGVTALAASSAASWSGAACATATSCLFVGGNNFSGLVVPVERGTAEPDLQVPDAQQLLGVACPTAGSCVAVGQTASGGLVVTLHRNPGGRWTLGAVHDVPGQLSAIACGSSWECLAVGSGVVEVTNGSVGHFRALSSMAFNGVACPTPTVCIAVGNTGTSGRGAGSAVWATVTAGSVGSSHLVPGSSWLNGIACFSGNRCTAAGEGNGYGVLVAITNGHTGSATVVTAVEEAEAISCPTAGDCEVVGPATQATGPADALVAVVAGEPRATITVPSSGGALVCASSSQCLVAGTQANPIVEISTG